MPSKWYLLKRSKSIPENSMKSYMCQFLLVLLPKIKYASFDKKPPSIIEPRGHGKPKTMNLANGNPEDASIKKFSHET